jgi:soluble lytic murein transglycosylase-like protein
MAQRNDPAVGCCRGARLLPPLLTVLIAGAACFSTCVHAADGHASRARGGAQVIMMVGGMNSTESDASRPAALTPSSSGTAPQVRTSYDTGRQSIVIGLGDAQPTVLGAPFTALPSRSVTSRIMALAPLVNEVARIADVDGALLMAVIDVESGGNPQAVSPKGATGLMQLMPDTGMRHGASDLFDPRQNIAAGARYLRQLMRQFGDLQVVLAAYNAGEGAVQKYGGQIPPYAETMSYVPKVMERYMHYRNATSSTSVAEAPSETQTTQGRFLLVRQNVGADD